MIWKNKVVASAQRESNGDRSFKKSEAVKVVRGKKERKKKKSKKISYKERII